MHDCDYQTDNENSKRLRAQSNSINDQVSNKRIFPKHQDVVEKNSKALEEALDKVRKAEYRLETQR